MVYTLVCHAEVKPECVELMRAKLVEAAAVYRKDRETLDCASCCRHGTGRTSSRSCAGFVMQDEKEPTRFSIVERFEHESSQKYRACRRVVAEISR